MRTLKRTLLRVFFGIEIAVFCFMYMCGAQSLHVRAELIKENELLVREIEHIQKEVEGLHQEILAWNSDDFYKEKLARERLGMAHKDDILYYRSAL